jgi:phosphoribosylanthranilate isomerase
LQAVTKVKVCGITNIDDARAAADLGAWALGLIFWPQSPRACEIDAAEQIGAELRRRTELVGVFVNAHLDELPPLAERAGLSILQLHGEEGPAYCAEAARRTGCKVMKAVRVKDASSVADLQRFHTDFHMLDAFVAGARGGTGETFNWELVARHRGDVPVVLSGGLDPDNVGQAVETTRPFAVDSASGTEAEPGRKDPARLKAFFGAVDSADRVPA